MARDRSLADHCWVRDESEQSRPLPITFHLYTLRQQAAGDFVGALNETANAGYTALEFAGDGAIAAPELRRIVDDLGLRAIGSHRSCQKFTREPEAGAGHHGATVGDGVTGWTALIATATATGTAWLIVEQEDDPDNAVRNIRRGLENLTALTAAGSRT